VSGTRLYKKPASAGFLFGLLLALCCAFAQAQDYAREKRWSDDIVATLMVGKAAWLAQKNGHRFLALYTEVPEARGAVIVAHGRGWSPDYELYGTLRTKLAEAGYTTLAIQLPVLDGTAKLVDYIATYPDARERFQLAVDLLKSKGYRRIAIVSHSLGASMANQYLIKTEDNSVKAWVFVGIINGLEEMYRIKVPVLDVFGSRDWDVTRWGADERRAQILKIAGSGQVIVPGAQHFFEGKEDALVGTIDAFLRKVLR
jgi:pimeloyl-ACP methyl ester carboxylesterase